MLATIALTAYPASGSTQGQNCPDQCTPDPQSNEGGSVPPGVTWVFNFIGTPEAGTATKQQNLETGLWYCPTCTPCKATLKLKFQANGTGATACYSPSGGAAWWGYPEGVREVEMSTNCDAPSQVIKVKLYAGSAACGSSGEALEGTATLDCNCINQPGG